MRKITFFVAALFAVMSLNSTVYMVTPAGAGDNSGSSWANAMPVTTVQVTIENNASAGFEFWLSKGTYTTKVFDFTGAAKIPVCKVYGGFSGDNDSETVETRNLMVNKTILDGGTTGIQMFKYGGGGSVTAPPVFPNDGNVYIDGVTFTNNGNLTKDYVLTFNTYKGTLSVVNCIFTTNSAKRGIVQMNNVIPGTTGVLNVINCLFNGNTITGVYNATAGTGSLSCAIFQAANCTCNIVNCTVANNNISTANPAGQLGIVSGQGNSIFNVSNNIIYGHTGITSCNVSIIEVMASAQVDNTFTSKSNASDLTIAGDNNKTLVSSPFVTGGFTLDRTNGALCVNSGDNSLYQSSFPAKDLSSNTRIAESTIDLGAFESGVSNGINDALESSVNAFRTGSKVNVQCIEGEKIQVYTVHGIKVAETVASSSEVTIDLPVKGLVILKTSRGTIKL